MNFAFNFYVAINNYAIIILQFKKLGFMKITALLGFIILLTVNSTAQPFLHTKGKAIVTADGKPFLIKGTNLGNWLVPEGYMFGFTNTNSPGLINEAISRINWSLCNR